MPYYTPENAVTASMNLYRKRFKTYLKISLISHLWFLIPIYGWAKFFAGIALISRLAFSEINGKTETIAEAQTHINPRTWSFLGAAILAFLGYVYRAIVWVIFCGIFIALLSSLMYFVFGSVMSFNYAFIGLIGLVSLGAFLAVYAWFFWKLIEIYSPFLLYEIPLAIEEKITLSTTKIRSIQLVEGLRRSVAKTILITVFATTPISILSALLWLVIVEGLRGVTFNNFPESTSTVVEQVIWLIYWGSLNILITPFWQALKSLVYYNLRCQKEAFDLPTTLSSPALYDSAGNFSGLVSDS